MKKSDLKTGMVIETRKGERGIILLDTVFLKIKNVEDLKKGNWMEWIVFQEIWYGREIYNGNHIKENF